MISAVMQLRADVRAYPWEAAVERTMVAVVTGYAGLGEQAARRGEAGDPAQLPLVPANVECRELREELELAVGQMVVNPPRHRLPSRALGDPVNEPRDDDRRHRSHAAGSVAPIPDVPRAVALVGAAALEVRVPERVHFGRAVAGPDRDAAEGRLQLLEQLLAQAPSGGDRQVGVVGQILK